MLNFPNYVLNYDMHYTSAKKGLAMVTVLFST
jgi:hypothetical protein